MLFRDMVETSEDPTLSDPDQGDFLESPSKSQASRMWLADPTDVSGRLAPLFFIPYREGYTSACPSSAAMLPDSPQWTRKVAGSRVPEPPSDGHSRRAW
jgi:hypothetical protein